FGRPDLVTRPAEENFLQLLADRSSGEIAALHRLRSWMRDEHRSLKLVFEARRSSHVRECHGDLHLGNMILRDDGSIAIFDCIEFNEDLRWIDVLNDVAFCAMDLTKRGRSDLAYPFLNGYLEQTGDYAGLAVLPYYLVYRATVRAKIAWLQFRKSSGKEKSEAQKRSSDYLKLAEAYAFRRQPELTIMHGVSASGKSFGSRELVKHTGAIRIRSDLERKRIARETGAHELYTPEMSRRTYDRLHGFATKGLQAGFPIILDATYLREAERSKARALAAQFDVPCRIVNVTAKEATLRTRIRKRQEKADEPSDATSEILEQQLASRDPLSPTERGITVDVDTDQPDCWARTIQARW
ncbi:MAG TPA: AAA family ATPase, partial [Opitutales bacterium]|nr:AAA family ATPase [Opitutales bacterium]